MIKQISDCNLQIISINWCSPQSWYHKFPYKKMLSVSCFEERTKLSAEFSFQPNNVKSEFKLWYDKEKKRGNKRVRKWIICRVKITRKRIERLWNLLRILHRCICWYLYLLEIFQVLFPSINMKFGRFEKQ